MKFQNNKNDYFHPKVSNFEPFRVNTPTIHPVRHIIDAYHQKKSPKIHQPSQIDERAQTVIIHSERSIDNKSSPFYKQESIKGAESPRNPKKMHGIDRIEFHDLDSNEAKEPTRHAVVVDRKAYETTKQHQGHYGDPQTQKNSQKMNDISFSPLAFKQQNHTILGNNEPSKTPREAPNTQGGNIFQDPDAGIPESQVLESSQNFKNLDNNVSSEMQKLQQLDKMIQQERLQKQAIIRESLRYLEGKRKERELELQKAKEINRLLDQKLKDEAQKSAKEEVDRIYNDFQLRKKKELEKQYKEALEAYKDSDLENKVELMQGKVNGENERLKAKRGQLDGDIERKKQDLAEREKNGLRKIEVDLEREKVEQGRATLELGREHKSNLGELKNDAEKLREKNDKILVENQKLRNRVKYANDASNYNLKTILELRIPLGLHKIDCCRLAENLKTQFLTKIGKFGLSRAEFRKLVQSLGSPSYRYGSGNPKLAQNVQKINLLFDYLDVDGNGFLDKSEVGNVLILMANGDKQHKIEAAFRFYDSDKNGFLTKSELIEYILGVLKLQWRCQHSDFGSKIDKKGLKQLAAISVKKVFLDLNIEFNTTQGVTLKQFKEYFANGRFQKATKLQKSQIHETPPKTQLNTILDQKEAILEDIKDKIDSLRRQVPLQKLHISVLLKKFLEAPKSKKSQKTAQNGPKVLQRDAKRLTKAEFKRKLEEIFKSSKIEIKFKDQFDSFPSTAYKIFDQNHNGILDLNELCTLFLILGGGSKKEKIGCIGRVLDRDGDGLLQKSEVFGFLRCFVKFVNYGVGLQVGVDWEAGVKNVVDRMFKGRGIEAGRGIGVDEFASLDKYSF